MDMQSSPKNIKTQTMIQNNIQIALQLKYQHDERQSKMPTCSNHTVLQHYIFRGSDMDPIGVRAVPWGQNCHARYSDSFGPRDGKVHLLSVLHCQVSHPNTRAGIYSQCLHNNPHIYLYAWSLDDTHVVRGGSSPRKVFLLRIYLL